MRKRTWSRLRLGAVTGAVGLAAVVSVSMGATAANAGARPPAVVAAQSSSFGATATVLDFITYYNGFTNGHYECTLGTNYNNPTIPITSALNQCGVRVWLHQYTYPQYKTSGWAYCVNPGGPYSIPATRSKPQNIQISSNSNPCP
jgi:hypothetical protein